MVVIRGNKPAMLMGQRHAVIALSRARAAKDTSCVAQSDSLSVLPAEPYMGELATAPWPTLSFTSKGYANQMVSVGGQRGLGGVHQ